MTEVNGFEPRPIKVLSPTSFSIEDTTDFSDYIMGGRVTYEKVPFTRKYKDVNSNFGEPNLQQTMTIGEGLDIEVINHITYLLLLSYNKLKKDFPDFEVDQYEFSEEVVLSFKEHISDFDNELFLDQLVELLMDQDANVKNLLAKVKIVDRKAKVEILLKRILKSRKFQFLPLACIIANMCSFEMIKLTGKFMPINQFTYVDLFDTFRKEFIDYTLSRDFTGIRNYWDWFTKIKSPPSSTKRKGSVTGQPDLDNLSENLSVLTPQKEMSHIKDLR
jgi:hypothetical protein